MKTLPKTNADGKNLEFNGKLLSARVYETRTGKQRVAYLVEDGTGYQFEYTTGDPRATKVCKALNETKGIFGRLYRSASTGCLEIMDLTCGYNPCKGYWQALI